MITTRSPPPNDLSLLPALTPLFLSLGSSPYHIPRALDETLKLCETEIYYNYASPCTSSYNSPFAFRIRQSLHRYDYRVNHVSSAGLGKDEQDTVLAPQGFTVLNKCPVNLAPAYLWLICHSA